jgi:hypothetical protein
MDDAHPLAGRIEHGARALVGRPFRPQGRGAAGLDCVGVVIEAAGAAGIRVAVRRDLPLRGLRYEDAELLLREAGCVVLPVRASRAGDLLVRVPATRQVHLAVRTHGGIVEAHAGLRRVVERPLPANEVWQACWRLPMGDD